MRCLRVEASEPGIMLKLLGLRGDEWTEGGLLLWVPPRVLSTEFCIIADVEAVGAVGLSLCC